MDALARIAYWLTAFGLAVAVGLYVGHTFASLLAHIPT